MNYYVFVIEIVNRNCKIFCSLNMTAEPQEALTGKTLKYSLVISTAEWFISRARTLEF